MNPTDFTRLAENSIPLPRPNRRRNVMHVQFDGAGGPIVFIDCGHLVEPLSRILSGWAFESADSLPGRPILTVRLLRNRYRLTSPAFEGEICEETPVSALCSLIVELVQARLATDPSLICLHCGAVELAGRLAVFPAIRRAGKSTLIARLAASGAKAFADDLLPIAADPDRGVSLGVALRLRLPLPARSGPTLQRFARAHAGLSDGYYQYLDLPPDRHAHHGEEAPIGAFIFLDRLQDGPTTLVAIEREVASQHLVQQNVARFIAAGNILRRIEELIAAAPAYLLRYSSVDEGAATLESAFRDGRLPPPASRSEGTNPTLRLRLHGADPRDTRPALLSAGRLETRYKRRDSVEVRRVGEAIFLVNPSTDAIFGLDLIGAAMWKLLAEPISAAEASQLLQMAFPASPPANVSRDVAALFSALRANGLIEAQARGPNPIRRDRSVENAGGEPAG